MVSYTYRLYLVAHKNHVLRRKKVLSACFALICINNGIVGPVLSTFMYGKDDNLHEHPKNISEAEIQFYMNREVVYLHNRPITRTFVGYMSYSIVLVISIIFYSSYAIVREIKKQEASASCTYIKHHRRVLKTLLIQTCSTHSVLFLASIVEAIHMFISISACFVEFTYVVLGLNFIVHSAIMLLFNRCYRNTIFGKILKRPQMIVHHT
ncbi:unnamed protein product [Auanema sp. JU1783]|nr:unnamed protein product [Auanema sp. JU1783]